MKINGHNSTEAIFPCGRGGGAGCMGGGGETGQYAEIIIICDPLSRKGS